MLRTSVGLCGYGVVWLLLVLVICVYEFCGCLLNSVGLFVVLMVCCVLFLFADLIVVFGYIVFGCCIVCWVLLVVVVGFCLDVVMMFVLVRLVVGLI